MKQHAALLLLVLAAIPCLSLLSEPVVCREPETGIVLLENECLRVQVDAEHGAVIRSLVNKKSGNELTFWALGKPGGMVAGNHDGSSQQAFTHEVRREQDSAEVVLTSKPFESSGKGTSATLTPPSTIRVIKKLRLDPARPLVHVTYTVQNLGQKDIPGMGIWVWNTFRPGPGETITPNYYRLIPSTAGPWKTAEWTFRKDLAAGWVAAVEPDAKEIVGAVLEPESLHAVYFWVRSHHYPTAEWMTPAHPLKAGAEITSSFSLVAVNGLDLLSHLCPHYAAKTWREEGKVISEIVLLDRSVPAFQLHTKLEAPDGRLLEEMVRESAGQEGVIRIEAPLQAAPDLPVLRVHSRLLAKGKVLGEHTSALLAGPSPASLPGNMRGGLDAKAQKLLACLPGEPSITTAPLPGWVKTEKSLPLLEPDEAEKGRGCILYRKGLMQDINSTFKPLEGERLENIKLQMARGEIEMADVIVHALVPGPVEISVDIPGLKTRILREEEREMYLSAYNLGMKPHLVSELLVPGAGADLEAEKSRRFWIEIETDSDTASGDHAGSVRLLFNGKEIRITLAVSVLATQLQAHPTRKFGAFVRNGLHLRELRRRMFKDLKRHGKDVIVAKIPGLGLGYDKEKDRITVDFGPLREFIEDLREAGMAGPVIFNFPDGIEGLTGCQHGDSRFVRYFQQMVWEFENYQILNSSPRLLWHPFDEQATYEPMATVTRWIKEAAPSALTLHTVVDFEVAKRWEHLDVWMPSGLALDPGVQEWCREHRKFLFSYSGKSRLGGGIQYYFNDTIQVMCPWTYNHGDWQEFYKFKDRRPNCFVFPNQGSTDVFSTLLWERQREGADDFRYLHTLAGLANRAKSQAAEQAKNFLTGLSAREVKDEDLDPIRSEMLSHLEALSLER